MRRSHRFLSRFHPQNLGLSKHAVQPPQSSSCASSTLRLSGGALAARRKARGGRSAPCAGMTRGTREHFCRRRQLSHCPQLCGLAPTRLSDPQRSATDPTRPDPPRHPRLGAAATPAPAPSTMARPGASAPARRSPPSTPSAAQQPTAAARVPEAASGLGCVPTAAPSAVGVVRPLRVAATADEHQRFASCDAARRVGTPAQSTPRFGQPLQGLGARVLHEGRRFGRRFICGCNSSQLAPSRRTSVIRAASASENAAGVATAAVVEAAGNSGNSRQRQQQRRQ